MNEELGFEEERTNYLSVHDIQRHLELTFHDVGQSGTWKHAHKEITNKDAIGASIRYTSTVAID